MFDGIKSVYGRIVKRPMPFALSLISMTTGFLISLLHFLGSIPYDRFSWVFFALSIALLLVSVRDQDGEREKDANWLLLLIVGFTVLYFASHLWDYGTAPWNSNGLFDDAAWDIYHAQGYTASNASIQIVFTDNNAGGIARELVFHTFIGAWFRLFGYNLFSFNMALAFLGYLTVLFTSLLAYRIFRDTLYTVFAALLLNFFPFHFTQVFMGHRYAICAPLMMISLYFLYYGLQRKSALRIAIGGVAAAVCVSSAVMGKQYLYALVGSAVLYLLFTFRQKERRKELLPYAALFAVAFLIALAPLLAYVLTNPEAYSHREASLMAVFFERIRNEGLEPLWTNLRTLFATVFSAKSPNRQFMIAYPILPLAFFPFVAVGTVLAFLRKHYFVPLMVAIPLLANLVTTAFDFRLMVSAPFYILAMVYAIQWIVALLAKIERIRFAASVVVIMLLFSPIAYLRTIVSDPNSEYLLKHTAVAASRFIQDVAAGEREPSFAMKPDEFDRRGTSSEYDTLAATHRAYAVAHAFLRHFDDRKVLSLLDNFPYRDVEPTELQVRFLHGIQGYEVSNKDLMLVFEVQDEIRPILDRVRAFEGVQAKDYTEDIDGVPLTMAVFRIPLDRIEGFRQAIVAEYGPLDAEREAD